MMRKMKVIIILFLMITVCPVTVHGVGEDNSLDVQQDYIEEQLNNLNIEEMERIIKEEPEVFEYFSDISVKDFIQSLLKGENVLDVKNIFKGIMSIFFAEVIENLNILIQIIVITIICALLINLQGAFEKESVGEIALFACYIILASLVIKTFVLCIELGQNTVNRMVDFMQIILPILFTLLVAIGGATTKLLFNPVIIGIINLISIAIKNFVFPLIFFSFIIGIISKMSSKIQFSKLSELLRQIVVIVISISMVIFIGVMSIYGVGAKIDGVSIRTAKFAVDNFVPIIGKFLSDAVETVVGCSAVLKNAIGLVGVFSIFLI
ncbi:MAG TPA: stage III sporulation protein AE, partial [Tissierellales bacterium]|nr:stage III sporulation protein AE [Tissierellales bacterium]